MDRKIRWVKGGREIAGREVRLNTMSLKIEIRVLMHSKGKGCKGRAGQGLFS